MSDAPGNAPDGVPDTATLDVVLFSAGGWRAGFEARRVRAARLAPAGSVDKGIEAQLGFSPDAPGPSASASAPLRQRLRLKGADDDAKGDTEMLVDGPVDLVCLPVTAIHSLPPLLAARTRLHGLRALALVPETAARQIVLLFDTAGLRAGGTQADDCPAPDSGTEPPR